MNRYIGRSIEKAVKEKLVGGKAVIIYGPRQSGKTTLAKKVLEGEDEVVYLSGDATDEARYFREVTRVRWQTLLAGRKTVFIDEAQKVENAGRAVKLLVDSDPSVRVIMTGSSSFSLANATEEPLTGRKNVFTLLPLSFAENARETSPFQEIQQLERRLVFGSYPQVETDLKNAEDNLKMLSQSYLFRDLLEYAGIRKPDVLVDILTALAWQVGGTLSLNELSSLVGHSRTLVESYLTLLEESFIIFKLKAYSTNKRNEIKKASKYYFWDNGIRNSLIKNLHPLSQRDDVGALWENYLVSERLKRNMNINSFNDSYFWRTSDGLEVDYVEVEAGRMKAFEFKWNPAKGARATKAFANRYPEVDVEVITPENYHEFLAEG